MENIILEKYQKSPLVLGCSTLSDEFFEHKSIAILFNDIPIIIVGMNYSELKQPSFRSAT